jgi:hypothetical protein
MQAGRLSPFVEAIFHACFCDSLWGLAPMPGFLESRGCYSQSGFAVFKMSLDRFQLSDRLLVRLFGTIKKREMVLIISRQSTASGYALEVNRSIRCSDFLSQALISPLKFA